MTTADRAFAELTEHRHYVYRGCAPDPDAQGVTMSRYSAADPDLPLDAWGDSTEDGGLAPAVRLGLQRRALAICQRCPVLDACRTYANTEIPGAGLVEPSGIWGGQTSLERHRALIGRRRLQPVSGLERLSAESREAKRRLLIALARETDDELVAYRARMDVRTANWHRSALCKLLGLDKEVATRQQLLDAARTHGLLPARVRIVPDGRWPVVAAPTTDGARRRRIEGDRPVQLVLPGLPDYTRPAQAAPQRRRLTLVRKAPAVTTRPVPLLLPVRTMETAAA